MKLPKALLGAILLGIAVQTTSSCKKDKESVAEKAKKEAEKSKSSPTPAACPACGMG